MDNVDRNDLCPCGSGKKYKECCLQDNLQQQSNEQCFMQRLIGEILSYTKNCHTDEIKEAYEACWDELKPDVDRRRTLTQYRRPIRSTET